MPENQAKVGGRIVGMRTWTPLLAAAATLALAGCSTDKVASVPQPTNPAPTPNSPSAVVRLFEWAWSRRDTTAIRDAFTGDFVFVFAALDTAGNRYRSRPWTCEDEHLVSSRIFARGSRTEPPATRCELTFDPTLIVVDDPRPGKDPGWHKLISTNVDLRIKTEDQEYRIIGRANFYVVRGDSAIPPPRDTGQFPMDATRWLIERWEDETIPESGSSPGQAPAKAQPARQHSWGAVKAIYHDAFVPLVP